MDCGERSYDAVREKHIVGTDFAQEAALLAAGDPAGVLLELSGPLWEEQLDVHAEDVTGFPRAHRREDFHCGAPVGEHVVERVDQTRA
nr:hypothetical protein [Catenulispora rubra]